MRLLYVQDSLGTGGAERSNAELWKYLRKEKNATIKIIVLEHRKVGIEKEILDLGFDVSFLSNKNFLQQVFAIRDIIKEFKPDLVHSVLYKSFIRVRAAKKLISFYHIESIVNCSYSEIRFKDPKINSFGLSFYKQVNKVTQAFTDRFIALTEEVKDHSVKHLHIEPSRIDVIPRGREENPYLPEKLLHRQALSSELGIDNKDIIVLHVGRQEYQKGHLHLLKSIKYHQESFKENNVKFIFCGREGNATAEIRTFLSENPLKVETFWLGHRSDVGQIMAASDIFVFPSLFEGLGGALIEAQAAGLPVICSDIKVFEEVVEKDENAWMVETGDHEALSNKLLYLTTSEEERIRMGAKSLLNFRKRFQIKDIHDRMYSLYKTCIS